MCQNETELERWLESDDSEEYRDANFAYLHFDLDYGSDPLWSEALYHPFKVFEAPYWLEEHQGKYCQYQPGYHEHYEIRSTLTIDGIRYKYIDSQPLPEEMEHQAENGDLAYEYRGFSFLRILEKLEAETGKE